MPWSSSKASTVLFVALTSLLFCFFGLSTEEGSSLEEIGFNWGEYLEETGASAAPHTSFKHVGDLPSLSGLLGAVGGESAGRCRQPIRRKEGKGKEIPRFLRHKEVMWKLAGFSQMTAGRMSLALVAYLT